MNSDNLDYIDEASPSASLRCVWPLSGDSRYSTSPRCHSAAKAGCKRSVIPRQSEIWSLANVFSRRRGQRHRGLRCRNVTPPPSPECPSSSPARFVFSPRSTSLSFPDSSGGAMRGKTHMSEYLGWDERRPPSEAVAADRDDLKKPNPYEVLGGPACQGFENYVRNIFRPGAKVPGEQNISAHRMLGVSQQLGKDALDESIEVDMYQSPLDGMYAELGLDGLTSRRSYVKYPVYTPKQSSEWFSRSHNIERRPSELVGSSYDDRHTYGGYSSYRERSEEEWKKNNKQMLVDYQKFDSSPLSPYLYQAHPYVQSQDSRIIGSNFVQVTTRPRDRFLEKIDKTLAEVRAMPRYI
uniref:Focal adhesion kinase 1 n=2 Tax=Steinernema glaseri TaxID=37863 RepID=A0A1I8AGC1_9BILA